jgi:hypothetical protein
MTLLSIHILNRLESEVQPNFGMDRDSGKNSGLINTP